MSKISKALEKARQERGEEISAFEDAPKRTEAPEAPAKSFSATKVVPLCDVHQEQHRILTAIRDPAVMDRYDLLRTQILMRTRDKGWNTLMITSVKPGEGKTLTAINLALSMAREAEQTALLVGTNLRNPQIACYLGLEEGAMGLSEYLLEDVPVSQLLVNPGIENLVVLPAGRPMRETTDIFGLPKMKQLVSELKTRYPDRYVIYDCPHILDMPDTLVFSSYVDAVVLVVEADRTPRKDILTALKTLEGRSIVGLVMNKALH